ncbi:hypothetical protein IW137_000326 [Coemansia sp. RSA 1287]|nr:hypothetical protein GGH15_001604 [Coemansia sp. RSA 562]KAJ2248811.1 hypothetical protein GGH97_001593 [Coemansia sp. RSA 475]KAJ2265565.1 hypothetical protein EV176_005894 [Coemansia sp. RSA 451]KAJ2283474.1 hypothetical protein GGH14_000844 [Coemansia sp. RSA 370]KAJ2652414.1 hypothetical protein IW137_000326 [Coemansia sp. RSA 1287]
MDKPYAEPLVQLTPLFPDVDPEVIVSVLQAQGSNLDRLCNVLMEMSNPAYKPTTKEVQRQQGIDQDAAFAWQLAKSELLHAHQQHLQRPMYPRRVSGSSPAPPPHVKKQSCICDIFKFGHSRSGSNEPARDMRNEPLDMQAQSLHTLASDFSDELDEPPSHHSHHSQLQQQHHQQHQQQTTSNNGIFGLFDDSNLDLYTPLSLSKMVTPHAANNSQTNVDTAPHASKHSYLTNVDNVSHTANYNHSLVDLDHPFDDNPLLHSSPASPMVQTRDQLPPRSPSTNPFSDMVQPPSDTAAVDTNPFRNSHPA